MAEYERCLIVMYNRSQLYNDRQEGMCSENLLATYPGLTQ